MNEFVREQEEVTFGARRGLDNSDPLRIRLVEGADLSDGGFDCRLVERLLGAKHAKELERRVPRSVVRRRFGLSLFELSPVHVAGDHTDFWNRGSGLFTLARRRRKDPLLAD